jgi:hypothetical protein
VKEIVMNEDVATQVPLTAEIFHKYLSRDGPIKNYFAETAGVLIKQMESVCSPPENGARTYGFVIQDLSAEECQVVRALLYRLKLTAEINLMAKVDADNNTVASYAHIVCHTLPSKKKL